MSAQPDIMARLRELVARHGSISAAARAVGIHRATMGQVLLGYFGAGPKVYRAVGMPVPPDAGPPGGRQDPARCNAWLPDRLSDDERAAIERRKGIARELKRQAWERGMVAIPRDRLGEIR